MKENKRLVSEVIKDIEHDMTRRYLACLQAAKYPKTQANRQRMNTRSASARRIK